MGGLALLLIGGEALVRGAVAIGERYKLSPLLVGMVIAGFGTSMPELVVSVRATVGGSPAIAAGNVIGSNISNILLILGVAALIRPIGRPPRLFVPDGFILVAVSICVVLLGLQGRVPAWQGGVMVAVLIGFIAFQYVRDRSDSAAKLVASDQPPVALPSEMPRRVSVSVLLILAGLGGLIAGADWFVDGAVKLARTLGVSEGLIGLTIVAIGTSLPELATSAIASIRGQSEIAYGNVLGSNMFNLLGIFGCAAIAGPMDVPRLMVLIDGPVMIGATALMLVFLATGMRLVRWEGAAMLICYALYIAARAGLA
ncbi:MAG TPA: calcium/sodium antiporter [Alphaproteobacteria bacterium]|nr:calcium/sodium antiporter [Alphaproteobacteria bacterium]